MLLSYARLQRLIDDGVIVGDNKEKLKSQVNGSSIDITLGDEIICEGGKLGDIISLADRQAFNEIRINIEDNKFWLHPGDFILAHSREKFFLPNNISADYKTNSTMGRLGLEHAHAGWCDPGWHGSVLTLELSNVLKRHTIELKPGDRIGQIVFFEHECVPFQDSYAVKGSYNNDSTVSGTKRKPFVR